MPAILCNKFVGLSLIDQVLLVILIISLVCKLLKSSFAYFFKRHLEHSMGGGKCKFLGDDGSAGKCANPLFEQKQFKDNGDICKKKECSGYRAAGINADEVIETHIFFSVLSIFADWGIQLPSVLLIIRTLLEVKTS